MSDPIRPETPLLRGRRSINSLPATHRWLALAVIAQAASGLALAREMACQAAVQAPTPPVAAVVVPFEMLPSNHMVMQAKLNGKGPYRLIFDVGAPVTLLSNRAAEGSGAVDPKTPRSFLMGMRGEAELGTLEIGDVTAKKLPVVVFDHPALKALSGFFKPIDGIIGYTFFARYKTTIDYQAHTMTLEPVASEVKNLLKDLPERMMRQREARSRVVGGQGVWGMRVSDPPGDRLSAAGVSVEEVVPGSPAAAADLRPRDVMISLNGRWTSSVTDALTAAGSVPPGRAAPLIIRRGETTMMLMITPRPGL